MNTRAENTNSIEADGNGRLCEPTGAGGADIYWLATYQNTTCNTRSNCPAIILAKSFPLPMVAQADFAMQIGKQ